MSGTRILGLHHMTAICGPVQENIDFYAGVLGLRLVKLTVNFDDPSAYHLYYGDGQGTPGTILTFFPYPDGYPGRPGTGQATVTALGVPSGSLRYWADRLKTNSVDVENARGKSLDFTAPDGLRLRLVANGDYVSPARWEHSPVPSEYAIGAMQSIVLEQESGEGTKMVLTEVLEMHEVEPNVFAFANGPGRIEILHKPEGPKGRGGRGSVHHIAFRAPNDEVQDELHSLLYEKGLHVSPIMNRDYFKSIYFREPGGVLFEIATDPPGFTVDESLEDLGTSLRLPKHFEPYRVKIERGLPALQLP